MFALDPLSAIHFGDGELCIDFGDGDVDMYRIKGGQLEFFTGRSPRPAWYPLTPEEILQHVVLHTPLAVWLHVRLRLKAAREMFDQLLEDTRGGVMVTDPVCGMEIEEIDVPESLQAEFEGEMYYFCSHESKMEFEQNWRHFVHAA